MLIVRGISFKRNLINYQFTQQLKLMVEGKFSYVSLTESNFKSFSNN